MIVLDTHIWVWWVQGDARLSAEAVSALDARGSEGIGVSAISFWEVAMLHGRGRVEFACPLDAWLIQASGYPGVQEVGLSREVLVESCRLPGELHRDPADRMIIATARELNCSLITADERILAYPHVRAVSPQDL